MTLKRHFYLEERLLTLPIPKHIFSDFGSEKISQNIKVRLKDLK